jgi:hypothetical protein
MFLESMPRPGPHTRIRRICARSIGCIVALALIFWLWPRAEAPAFESGESASEPAAFARTDAPTVATTPDRPGAVTSPAPGDRSATTTLPRLRLRLQGISAGVAWTTPIRIAIAGRNDVTYDKLQHGDEQLPGADGAVEFALPAWALSGMRSGVVTADDPRYELAPFVWKRQFDFEREHTLVVTPAAAIAGRVADSVGDPVPNAEVNARRIGDDEPVGGYLASTTANGDGSYLLRLPPNEAMWVTARVPAQRSSDSEQKLLEPYLWPAGAAATAFLGQEPARLDFVLERATLAVGRIRFENGDPVGGVGVYGLPADAESLLTVGDAMPGGIETTSDAEGRFELPLLATVVSRVVIHGSRPRLWIAGRFEAAVLANQEIEIVLPNPTRLRAMRSGQPVPFARFQSDTPRNLQADADGELLAVFGEATDVRAFASGVVSKPLRIGPESAGRVVAVELTEQRVAVEFEFSFAGATPHIGGVFVGSEHGTWFSQGLEQVSSGVWRASLSPGRNRLRFEFAAGGVDGCYVAPVERDIEVGTEPTRVRVDAEFGGLFTLAITDPAGRAKAGSCRVLDSSGIDRTPSFRSEVDAHGFGLSSGRLRAAKQNVATTPLPVGSYALHVDVPGFATQQHTLVLRQRETTHVEVRLP